MMQTHEQETVLHVPHLQHYPIRVMINHASGSTCRLVRPNLKRAGGERVRVNRPPVLLPGLPTKDHDQMGQTSMSCHQVELLPPNLRMTMDVMSRDSRRALHVLSRVDFD